MSSVVEQAWYESDEWIEKAERTAAAITEARHHALQERVARLPEEQWQAWLDQAHQVDAHLQELVGQATLEQYEDRFIRMRQAALDGAVAEIARVITRRKQLKEATS